MWCKLRILVTAGPHRCLAIFGIISSVLGICGGFGFFFTWLIPLASKVDIENYYGFAIISICLAFVGFIAVYYAFLSYPELGAATKSNDIEFVTFEKENLTPTSYITDPVFDIPIMLSRKDNEITQNSGVQHVNININDKRYSFIDSDGDFSAIIFKTPQRRNSRNKENMSEIPKRKNSKKQENEMYEVPKMRTFKPEIQTSHRPLQVSRSLQSELRSGGYFLDETSRVRGKIVRTNSQDRK